MEPDETSIDLAVYRSDDWDGVYINGKLAYSGSENLIREVLELIEGKTIRSTLCGYVECGTPEGDKLEETGDFPMYLHELLGQGV